MTPLPDEARSLVESTALGHVVTLNPDGSPHLTCVWIGWDDGDIVFASATLTRKIRNLRRDPRVAVSVESDQIRQYGLKGYLRVHGTASVTDGGGLALLRGFAPRYLGPGVPFQPEGDPRDGYRVRVAAEKIGGIGPWARPAG
jgi:PPOX class probable F420-dependent enzyme